LENLSDVINFCGIDLNPDMNISLMNNEELVIAHLFTHNSYAYSKPKFGKDNIKNFHSQIVNEFLKREKHHPIVDILDKVYK